MPEDAPHSSSSERKMVKQCFFAHCTVLGLEWAKPLLETTSLLSYSRNGLQICCVCIQHLHRFPTELIPSCNTLIHQDRHIPSTQLVEKKAMFLVSSGFSLEKSGDLV